MSNEPKYTPRPWRKRGLTIQGRVPGKGWRTIATCPGLSSAVISGIEREANAALIVATLDLLAACKLTAALPEENFHGCNVGAAIRAARIAIAKAEPAG